ncbi:amidase [Actinospongicola halichondriae]|uniref:amidase n=1 Tax=Actinospongicola halichondriae TaxID=3236844 RepID=UPI003D5099E4
MPRIDEELPPTVSSFANDVLADHDAVALAELVRSGDAAPVELVDAMIARAEAAACLDAISVTDYERARAIAERRPIGAFGGVPTFIKDNTAVAGLRTGHGSETVAAAAPSTADGAPTELFRKLGTIVMGTTRLPEFGLICSTEFPDAPPVRNPWNTGRSAGASSGGAGALVAAGVLPMAHANDGGGSIRIPAAANGLVGMMGTRKRVVQSNAKVQDRMPVDIGYEGVLTRSVRDQCAFFEAAEREYHHPPLPPIGLVDRPLDRPLRIAFHRDSPVSPVDAAVSDAATKTAQLLASLGHEVTEVEPSVGPDFADDFVLYWALAALTVERFGQRLLELDFDRELLTPFTRTLARHARRNLHKMPGAIRRLKASTQQVDAALGNHDVILHPTVGSVTPELGWIHTGLDFDTVMPRMLTWATFTALYNASGHPSISLPLGHDEPTNTPIGMHFSARWGQERTLLELGLQLEEASPFRSVGSPRRDVRAGPHAPRSNDTT